MLSRARHRAKKRGLEFSITQKDFDIPEVCPVLGIPLQISDGKLSHGSPSLDRINNDKGYIPGNVAIISQKANWLKSNGTLDQLKQLVRYLENIQEEKNIC